MLTIAFELRRPPLPLGDRAKKDHSVPALAAVKRRPRSGWTSAELSARPSLGGFVSALLTGRCRLPASPMVDCLGRIVLGRVEFGRIALVVLAVRHALLEGFDALRNIAHQLGDLAAPEQQEHDADHYDPMPQTHGTHRVNPPQRRAARSGPRLTISGRT